MDKVKFQKLAEEMKNFTSDFCFAESNDVKDFTAKLIVSTATELIAAAGATPKKSEMPCNCKQKTFLKPCPFCGNKEVDICSVDMGGNPMKPRIYCSTCETIWQAMRDVSPEYFAQQWNTRNVAVAQMDAEVAKCDCIKEKPKTLEDILEEAKAELTDSKTFVTIMLRRVDD